MAMEIPVSFKAEIEKREKREKAERIRDVKEKRKVNAILKEYQEEEDIKIEAKTDLCKKIFGFKEKFLETPEGKKLFKKKSSYLLFFIGNWGHKPHDKSDEAAVSMIYFTDSGIHYDANWKWMGPLASFDFKEPDEMAKRLGFDYLKELLSEIESEKIFKGILELNRY